MSGPDRVDEDVRRKVIDNIVTVKCEWNRKSTLSSDLKSSYFKVLAFVGTE